MMTPEIRSAAIAFAMATIAADPGIRVQALRAEIAAHLGGDTFAWTDAVRIGSTYEVRAARLEANHMDEINDAFAADRQMFVDSIALGAVIDNPWVLDLDGNGVADAGRAEALDLRVFVIAMSHQGDATRDGNADGVWSLADVPVVPVEVVGVMPDAGGL